MRFQNILVVALITIAVLVAGRMLKRRPAPVTSPDLHLDMAALADKARSYAKSQNILLDNSPDSIEQVETLLATLHTARAEGRLNDEETSQHGARFGAYIGEVLRITHDGHWAQDHPVAGKDSFPLHWKGHQSFPLTWCLKRLQNGPEDNVWHKFQILTSPTTAPSP